MANTNRRTLKDFVTYPAVDIQRGLNSLISTCITVLYCYFAQPNLSISINLIIAAALAPLIISGNTKKEQSLVILIGGILISVSQLIALWLIYQSASMPLLLYPILAVAIFILLCIPRLWAPLSTTAMVAALLIIVLTGVPHESHYITNQDIKASLALCAGYYIVLIIHLCLPTQPIPCIPVDQTSYFFKRNFRIAITVAIGMYVATLTHLKHPAWLGLTVIVVSRNNLGASIRIAAQRLFGTFIAVALGIPAAWYLFIPHPTTRWLSIFSLFAGMTVVKKHYDLGIFLLTFILAAGYLLILTDQTQIISIIADRLLETAVGILIAIISEIIIFPQHVLSTLRALMQSSWEILATITTNIPKDELEKKQSALEKLCKQQRLALEDYKFECFWFFSLRYQACVAYVNLFHSYIKHTLEAAHNDTSEESLSWLEKQASIAQLMKDAYQQSRAERLTHVQKVSDHFDKLNQSQAYIDPNISRCENELATLLERLIAIISTPWYRLRIH